VAKELPDGTLWRAEQGLEGNHKAFRVQVGREDPSEASCVEQKLDTQRHGLAPTRTHPSSDAQTTIRGLTALEMMQQQRRLHEESNSSESRGRSA
jgi:hypothetical protein